MLLSTASYAATPLDDVELNNNFLQNNIPVSQLALDQLQNAGPTPEQTEQQLEAIDQNTRINNVFANLVQATGISNIQVSLNKKDREVNFTTSNPLFGIDILNEIAVNDFGSEPFSFRWAGNFTQMFDLSQINSLYFDHSTGSYELNNIQGIVEIEASTYQGNEESRKFRRDYHVF
ncbi:hypothetical protein BKE30_07320 [Alkanindiges hydrocarboniclasticus]|uniref:Uncharacterized protein n=1 Tax=Alkanindiges hydrocarboniclasticus TaxID=1907941 RepID=A0A1S8CUB8_9GAMM|nr:hypothetical protein BKE30_07320 [Alkanindiges hydrocarboniclasticus]